jgi:DNA repair exonuclease SbcCD ATPase subunit
MIVFQTIKWKNFLSTGNVFTEVNLNTRGTTLVVGENGAGKSTILDALTFALFGKTFRNINKPQLLNAITRKDLQVEVEFSIGTTRYRILRGMKPNLFEVYCNDTLVNQSAEMRDYQEYLEKNILKINYKSFCQVVVLGSASFVPFMQLPAAQRRAIIEDLLDLQVFTTMNTLLKDNAQENAEALQINNNDQRLINEKIKMVREHLREMQSKSEQFIKEKRVALKDVQTKISEAEATRDDYRRQIIELGVNLTNTESLQNKVDKLKSLRSQMENKSSILNRDIEFFSNHDNCPTCKQQISSEFSCEVVGQRKNDIKAIEDGLKQLAIKYDETNDELMIILDIDKQCDELRSKASHETLRIQILNDQIKTINQEIDAVKKEAKGTSDVKISDLENELTELTARYNELQEDRLVLNAAALLLKDGGIKTKIVNQYVPVINKLINKYLGEFDLFVEFNLDEQFNEVIKSRYRDEFTYASFSEGEKSRINLAILFTWRAIAKMRNSLSTNLLILDEVFDGSLDSDAADNLNKILNQLSQDNNVFVISHKENIQDKFLNVIKFVKHQNFSKIDA